MEFIVLAVLAAIGSAAIVLFVVKPAAGPPAAQADGVVAQQDTPESIFALTAPRGDVLSNSVGMNLIYIRAGAFMMGSSDPATELAEQ